MNYPAFFRSPGAVLSLITGFSPISKKKQLQLEQALTASCAAEFVPVFRFAITSDIHIQQDNDVNRDRFAKLFETAYAYSDSHPTYQTLDAVLLAGDNTDSGREGEYDKLTGVIRDHLRPGTRLISVMGNHEFATTGHEGYVRRMGEPLDKHEVVKGFHIIGLSPTPNDTWHSPKQMLWMAKELRKAEKAAPGQPIFTLQHGHIWRTIYVSRSWYTQMSIPLHKVFSKFPQVINFSGHSHGPINNPLEIWQNQYTQLGTGTLNYFEMERDIGDETVPEGSRNAAQYLIVEVDAKNRVRVLPYNILTEDFFKTTATTEGTKAQLIFQMDHVTDKKQFPYTAARKKTASIPRFRDGATLRISCEEATGVSVTFEQAEDPICVYGYRITAKDPAHPLKKAAKKEIYSEYYFEPMPRTCTCTLHGLTPGTRYQLRVTPMNVWRQCGAPLTAEFTTAASDRSSSKEA